MQCEVQPRRKTYGFRKILIPLLPAQTIGHMQILISHLMLYQSEVGAIAYFFNAQTSQRRRRGLSANQFWSDEDFALINLVNVKQTPKQLTASFDKHIRDVRLLSEHS